MIRTLLLAALLVALTLSLPGAVADPLDPPNPDCDPDDVDCIYGTVKRTVTELDPRNWPCPCDPEPQPW